jgi:hypothetical protein
MSPEEPARIPQAANDCNFLIPRIDRDTRRRPVTLRIKMSQVFGTLGFFRELKMVCECL